MSNVTLSVKNLRKVINDKEIIKNIHFELHEGEVFGFLGPNGSGKTTTIRMIVGLIKPTEGSIEICGYDIQKNFTKAMNHLGCIVENPEMYPYLTGWENLKIFSAMLKNVKDTRLLEVVELVGLSSRIHDKVKTYSLGMKQRLGIAQALIGRPKILILDEPTNGLDPSGIKEMRELIKLLAKKEKLSVFVSSHLLSEIQIMCDRVAIISKGSVKQVGSVQSLLAEQQLLLWRVSPIQDAIAMFQELGIKADLTNEFIVTPYDEQKVGEWNKHLVENGITVLEMTRKVPQLEELFLQMTGGDLID